MGRLIASDTSGQSYKFSTIVNYNSWGTGNNEKFLVDLIVVYN